MSSQRLKFKSLQIISGLTIVVTLAGLFVHFIAPLLANSESSK